MGWFLVEELCNEGNDFIFLVCWIFDELLIVVDLFYLESLLEILFLKFWSLEFELGK